MPKIVCHMANGFEFAHFEARCRVPAEPAEVELEHEWQERVLRADCRVVVLDGLARDKLGDSSAEEPAEDHGDTASAGEPLGEDGGPAGNELEGEPRKPLSRMNRGELQEVARELGIDPEQTKKKLLAAIEKSI